MITAPNVQLDDRRDGNHHTEQSSPAKHRQATLEEWAVLLIGRNLTSSHDPLTTSRPRAAEPQKPQPLAGVQRQARD